MWTETSRPAGLGGHMNDVLSYEALECFEQHFITS